ncbi:MULTISPECIES: tail fiber domain-containing protein [Luteibacter]|uniref:tail fiber domain-containing protein n=1 Tax=Luteibacter TaxID=242605 RepID=UPI00056771F5|nr:MULTISPECIES: tail fiber domain-containing protein [unclassified Luteibacter]
MAQSPLDFRPVAQGGDNPTAAFVKLDGNDKDLDTRVTAAKTAADNAQTAAGNASTAAGNAANTANAAMPKTGGTFTGSVGVTGSLSVTAGSLGTAAGSSLSPFTITANDSNVDRVTSVLYRGPTGTNFASAFWRQQRVVDATGFGFLQMGDGTNAGTILLNSVAGSFTMSGSTGNAVLSGTLTQNSDYRIKDDVVEIDAATAAEALRQVRPVEYTDNRMPTNGRLAGFIAHELQEHLPLLVQGQKDATQETTSWETDPNGEAQEDGSWPPLIPVTAVTPVLQSVAYDRQVVYLTAAWKWMDAQLTATQTELVEAKAALAALTDRIAALESR